MVASSLFPEVITFDNTRWHLLHDPASAMTTQPNLEGSRVVRSTCDPVKVPNNNNNLYMVVVDLLFPAKVIEGRMMSEKRLRAFRIYDHAPVSLDSVRPDEMVYYIAEPSAENDSTAQGFLNTILGVAADETARKNVINTTWGKDLLVGNPVSKEAQNDPNDEQDSRER